ncbi:MAG: FAD-dependent oxidoreductase, partial [Pseudomonadota bacterium]
MSGVLIVGAGHAAGQAAASLKQEGYEGEIRLLGDEPFIPYQRPPLSKAYLAGEQPLERVYLRPEKFYADKGIAVETNVRVDAIDAVAQTATTSSGAVHSYEHLILATGSRPRILRIDGSDLPGIHYLRTVADVDAIRSEIGEGKRIVIVGGGYIGLEVASVCVSHGMQVHVLEMEDRILKRVTTPHMSAYYHQLHEGRGVHLHVKTQVSGFSGDGRVQQVHCGDTSFDADLVIVGIGIIPNVELAEAAGIECDNGILVDDHCRTSAAGVWAIGDCTNHPNATLNRRLRLESVPNAMDQARVTAANICGKDKTYDAVPWFWSDQYELKLQMVGFSTDGDTHVIRGSQEDN